MQSMCLKGGEKMRPEFKCRLVDGVGSVVGYLKLDDGAGPMFSEDNGRGWYSMLRFGVRDRERGPFIGFCTGKGCKEIYFSRQEYFVCQDNRGFDVFEGDRVRLPQEGEEPGEIRWFDVYGCWCVHSRIGFKSVAQVKEEGGMILIKTERPVAESASKSEGEK
jgi:hypothetical protein